MTCLLECIQEEMNNLGGFYMFDLYRYCMTQPFSNPIQGKYILTCQLAILFITLRWWYTPAIIIFMTFFLVKYLVKGAGTEAK